MVLLCQARPPFLQIPVTNPDYHWQPSADQAYTFDLAKAGQLLTAAGYPLKDGVRLDKQGKPIVLRLEVPTDKPAGADRG